MILDLSDPGLARSLAAARIVVCAVGDRPVTVRALQAIAGNTPAEVPIVPVTASQWRAVSTAIAGLADVVLITGDCRPPAGWLARLREAVHSEEVIGTASAFTEGLIGEPGRVPPQAVADPAARLRPRVPTCGPQAVYVRREVLQLVDLATGVDDVSQLFSRLGSEVAATGMLNVLADDLLIPTEPGDESRSPLGDGELEEGSPLQRAVRLARIARRGLRVTIDGRSLNRVGGGTQRYALELVLALDRVSGRELALRIVLPPDPPEAVTAAIAQRPEIEAITYGEAIAGVAKSDVVHRPQQVFSIDDLNLMRLLGDRMVITHQDLIGFHDLAYHASEERWQRYRFATRLALAAADRTIFFSQTARRDAEAEGLIDLERSDVIGIALDEPFPESPLAPRGLEASDEFVVCLGADYRHKNRPFAVRLFGALRERHGFTGRLVLAGGHVEHGSSTAEERAALEGDPGLAAAVIDLGPVSEPERTWLLHHATALIVPSVVEGFGLMPLEAAAAGVPCLFAARSSLREVVSEDLATLVCWDAPASAAAAAELLGSGPAREDHVRRLREDAARWSWDELAPKLLASYEEAARGPVRAATSLVWQAIDNDRTVSELSAAHHHLAVTHQDLLAHLAGRDALARDDGFFTEAELRGLWRVGSRPALRRAVMWPFELLGGVDGERGPPGLTWVRSSRRRGR